MLISAHARHSGRPSKSRPGRRCSSPQRVQVPRVRTAAVKQAPQIAPSGQRARIFDTPSPHRSQCRCPVVRGRPRRRGSVSAATAGRGTVLARRGRPLGLGISVIVGGDPGPHRAVGADVGQVVTGGGFPADRAGVRGYPKGAQLHEMKLSSLPVDITYIISATTFGL